MLSQSDAILRRRQAGEARRQRSDREQTLQLVRLYLLCTGLFLIEGVSPRRGSLVRDKQDTWASAVVLHAVLAAGDGELSGRGKDARDGRDLWNRPGTRSAHGRRVRSGPHASHLACSVCSTTILHIVPPSSLSTLPVLTSAVFLKTCGSISPSTWRHALRVRQRPSYSHRGTSSTG